MTRMSLGICLVVWEGPFGGEGVLEKILFSGSFHLDRVVPHTSLWKEKTILAVTGRNGPSVSLWPHLSYDICIDTICYHRAQTENIVAPLRQLNVLVQ